MNPDVHRTVCALVGSPGEPLRRALASGPGAPRFVVEDTRLRPGLEQALASGAEWIWVLDGSAVPRPNALPLLLEALDRTNGLPAPALLTGVVVTPEGRLDVSRSPWYHRFQLGVSVDSAERGLAPVRGSLGPALVDREAVEATLSHARGPLTTTSVLHWTARVLRGRTGYLVPDSESEGLGGGADPMRRPGTAARLILTRAVVWRDRWAVVLELAERSGRGRT